MTRESTPNRSWDLPVPDESTDWGTILNDESFAQADADVQAIFDALEDKLEGADVAGGDKITASFDAGTRTVTIDTGALDGEEVEDRINDTLVGGSQVTTTYDDGAGALTITIDAPTQAAFDDHSTRHESGGADEMSVAGLSGDLADEQDPKAHAGEHENGGVDELNVSGLSGVLADAQTPQTEAVQDIVGALVQANGNISVTYDDAGNVLTIDTAALNTEEVEDAVAALVTAGNAITVNYDDANDALSIGVDESALSFYDGTNLTAPVDNESVSTEQVRGAPSYPDGFDLGASYFQSLEYTDVANDTWQSLPLGEIGLHMLAISNNNSGLGDPRAFFVIARNEAYSGVDINRLAGYNVGVEWPNASLPRFKHTEGSTQDMYVEAWRVVG